MTKDRNENKTHFDGKKFVENLLNDGLISACDATTVDCSEIDDLPEWYDEQKFKKGQKFFHDNIFALFLAKLLGLLTILAIPTILKILMFTNMSSTTVTAYKRYMATILHMCVWYDNDFKPGSNLWRSIREIRGRHFNTSRRACKNNLNQISQADMALTQFGFMGFAITKPEDVGIHNATEEEIEGFIHVWRTVGYLLGIEDRFNICRDSIEETRSICNQLVSAKFKPNLLEADSDFKHMAYVLINGMTVFNPFLNYDVFIYYIHELCNCSPSESNKKIQLYKMDSKFNQYMLAGLKFYLYIYKYSLIKWYLNAVEYFALFLMKYLPFLAFYKYGFKDSYVRILDKTYTD